MSRDSKLWKCVNHKLGDIVNDLSFIEMVRMLMIEYVVRRGHKAVMEQAYNGKYIYEIGRNGKNGKVVVSRDGIELTKPIGKFNKQEVFTNTNITLEELATQLSKLPVNYEDHKWDTAIYVTTTPEKPTMNVEANVYYEYIGAPRVIILKHHKDLENCLQYPFTINNKPPVLVAEIPY